MKPKTKRFSENLNTNSSQKEIESLIECNKILKEHIDFLRAKLKNAESLLELYLSTMESDEDENNKEIKISKFNLLNIQ